MMILLTVLIIHQVFDDGKCDEPHPAICTVRSLMAKGELDEAAAVAEEPLSAPGADKNTRIKLHLELAKILDRIGLHQNSRPVEESLDHIRRAERLLGGEGGVLKAHVELEKAGYHYRAEMEGREFSSAMRHAQQALVLFEDGGHIHGQSDAVHQLGLIHMQRREFDKARELFDRSLELDDQAGSRGALRGDYERHVGFLYFLDDSTAAAVPYFERSLKYRREAGLIDQSMFAAETFASALLDVGRVEEARDPLLYALMLAEKLDSPVGKSRVGFTLGRMYEQLGDRRAAIEAYEMTRRVAESVGYDSVGRLARVALERLEK